MTVNITCLQSVTGYYKITYMSFTISSGYEDIIICKWESNDVEHYDTSTRACCQKIGYSSLWSTGYITNFEITPTNDQLMFKKYISGSVLGRLEA
jgi:hypothetical protein